MKPDYSIVIPYHSNLSLLTNCVNSLIKSVPEDVEIIIVANNSNPDELKISFPHSGIHIETYQEDLLYPKAVNIGVDMSRGAHVILCDADTYYIRDWFKELISCYQECQAAIVGSKLIFTNNNRVRDFGMGYNGYSWPHPFKNRPMSHPLVMKNRPFQSVCTASCIVNKASYQAIGGLDERLGYSYSDMDLCLRFLEYGKTVWGCGHAAVYHKGSSIMRDMSHYRKDIRGKFCELNSQRFKVDMEIYYKEGAAYYLETHSCEKEYIMIDMSTVYNKAWHFDILKDLLNIQIIDTYTFEQTPRDKLHIELYECIPPRIFTLNISLIYFVDNYTALMDNCIWRELRDDRNDIVMDRHGNIVSFSHISGHVE